MRNGFSLVELSIVLVILGLLTGGILTGQTLIRAAELRAVTTEYQNYVSATQTFRDKYFGIPGDLRNASRFWNQQFSGSGCTGNGTINAAGACDGNGDGIVAVDTAAGQTGENLQFWRHLANAGLIEGTYSATAVGGVDGTVFGANVPRSKLSNAGWGIFTADSWNNENGSQARFLPDTVIATIDYDSSFLFGAAVSNNLNFGPALAPEEAWNIDTKLDDGNPVVGFVLAPSFNCNRATSLLGAGTPDEYDLTNTATACSLVFSRQY